MTIDESRIHPAFRDAVPLEDPRTLTPEQAKALFPNFAAVWRDYMRTVLAKRAAQSVESEPA